MSKHILVFTFLFMGLQSFASGGEAATLDLACSQDHLLGKFPAADRFSAQIQLSDERVSSVKVSMGGLQLATGRTFAIN